VFARAVKSSIRVNGENGLASDGTLEERYEYTPYGGLNAVQQTPRRTQKTERRTNNPPQDPPLLPAASGCPSLRYATRLFPMFSLPPRSPRAQR
jgi:hypothetical protein